MQRSSTILEVSMYTSSAGANILLARDSKYKQSDHTQHTENTDTQQHVMFNNGGMGETDRICLKATNGQNTQVGVYFSCAFSHSY